MVDRNQSDRRDDRRSLPDVTLCCVDCTPRLPWALKALQRCIDQASFGEVILFSDELSLAGKTLPSGVRAVQIEPLRSIEAYSEFMLKSLWSHIRTSHVLVVQWDGFVLDSRAWRAEFLEYDYIGAPWQHIPAPYSVGNGGFSLRSRRLLQVLAEPGFASSHPEDIAICRIHHDALVQRGIRFAPVDLAGRFSVEDGLLSTGVFGFHGAQHLPQVLSPAELLAFVQSLATGSLLSHFFGEFLGNLRAACARDAARHPAYVAFRQFVLDSVNTLEGQAALAPQALGVCKALIRHGQFEAALRLLRQRRLARGHKLPELKLWLRLQLKFWLHRLTARGRSE